jgi:hypothetical protein
MTSNDRINTVIGGNSPVATHVPPIAHNFPVALSTDQQALVSQNLATNSIFNIESREIVTLGSETEKALHRTLDGFLSKIDEASDPKIFKMIGALKEAVDKEDLPALADRIINPQPTLMAKLSGLFNKNAIAKALSEAWEETRRVAMGKTKTLVDVVQKMDSELRIEQQKLEGEIRSLEQLKESYRDRYSDFVVTVAFLSSFLGQSKTDVTKRELESNMNDPQQAAAVTELKDKLQALESRALALEGTLSRLPADQLVIRQLQNAAITTLQETTTTASARFSSIKMTLLTIHSALVTKSVQQLAQQGANLDENLSNVRATLMKDVVAKAATAPGDNRLAQAQQLKAIVAETSNLATLVEQARESNQVKFTQARELFAQARKDMLEVGVQLQPQNPIKY